MSAAEPPRSEVLACYERLRALSRQLLGHARREEWAALPALEEQCSAIVEMLRLIEPFESLDAQQLLHKHALLSRIRGDYDAIGEAVAPQLDHLREVLQTMQRQRMLQIYR